MTEGAEDRPSEGRRRPSWLWIAWAMVVARKAGNRIYRANQVPRDYQLLSARRVVFGYCTDCPLTVSYFAELPDDKVSQDEAANAEPTPDGFKSPFLHELLATAHFSDISGYVELKGWNTKQLRLWNNGGGVIAIAAAAVAYKTLPYTALYYSLSEKH
ncbi:hypothetical protein EV363DRAFT_1299799 [Boletus edulis]|nr:hypothetical protein EV363DRAFT_1299799 [Boletus edulis]